MFSFTYLQRELRRRAGRTVLTVLGLAVGVGMVAAITAVSDGLDQAQGDVLDPLSSVGTDLMVTRPVDLEQTQEGPPGFGGDPGQGPDTSVRDDLQALLEENSSVITDLSQLGDPGEQFEHTYFLPATQLTFESDLAGQLAQIDGVEAVGTGLTLLAVHQTGTVPEIVAEVQAGGETFTVEQEIEPPTAEEQEEIQRCMAEARQRGDFEAGRACFPERFQRFRGTFTTPQRTITQALNPPETDITSDTYTIAGIDLSVPGIGLITEGQIVDGAFFSADDAPEAVVASAYAQRLGIALGDEFDLNGSTFTVVGFAEPPLGGQTADVYLSLGELQRLSDREGRVNVVLVRADDAGSVAAVGSKIEQDVDGAQVTSAEDVATRVSGSLVDAANLADRLGLILSVTLLVAAFLIATLLTLSSIGKRVRELGTLKAIGWRTSRVVRQVMLESVAQGALGGLVGIGLGIVAALAIAGLAPPLEASAATSSTASVFGLGAVTATGGSDTIELSAPISVGVVALAFGLALLGGLIAGGLGAWRAARLRPADALREIG